VERKVFEFKKDGVDLKERTFEGLVSGTDDIDTGRDLIESGSFKKTITERVPAKKVKLLDAHDMWGGTKAILGHVLEAEETADTKFGPGVWMKAYVDDTQDGNDVLNKIASGTLDALSIGFEAIRYAFEEVGGKTIRRITEVKWWEGSVVPWGMHERALIDAASLKSLGDYKVADVDGEPIEGLPSFVVKADNKPVISIKGLRAWRPGPDATPVDMKLAEDAYREIDEFAPWLGVKLFTDGLELLSKMGSSSISAEVRDTLASTVEGVKALLEDETPGGGAGSGEDPAAEAEIVTPPSLDEAELKAREVKERELMDRLTLRVHNLA